MAENTGETPASKKVLNAFKTVGAVLAAPFMSCAMFYFCVVADKDPWGASNHPERDHRRREKRERKEQERREQRRESERQNEQGREEQMHGGERRYEQRGGEGSQRP